MQRLIKKLTKWKIISLFLIILPLIAACSNDSDANDNNSHQLQDIAVTGSCIEVGSDYARIEGYFYQNNLNITTTSLKIGIECSLSKEFHSTVFTQTNILEGNKFSAFITRLSPQTLYYYRACVKTNTLKYVGETRTFTTELPKDNTDNNNNDGPDYSTISITNGSGYDLPCFTVRFLNTNREELTSRDYGTLYDGDNIKATIPTAASQFYMATKLNGTWYFSAYYPIYSSAWKLTRAEVGNWTPN